MDNFAKQSYNNEQNHQIDNRIGAFLSGQSDRIVIPFGPLSFLALQKLTLLSD